MSCSSFGRHCTGNSVVSLRPLTITAGRLERDKLASWKPQVCLLLRQMAPKGKGGDKGKGKDAGVADKAKKGKKDGYQQINARHILCAKHSKKEEALAKLNEGSKFDDVAREFSEDKARAGGALGWKTKDSLLEDFWQAAVNLQPSTTTKPVWTECKTAEGYHIIMLEGGK